MRNTGDTRVVRGACPHDCPDTCAMLVTVEDGRATKVRGHPDHPFTRGGLCVKVNDYTNHVYSPDRVLYPLRRTGPRGEGRFGRTTWDEALDEIAGPPPTPSRGRPGPTSATPPPSPTPGWRSPRSPAPPDRGNPPSVEPAFLRAAPRP